MSDDPLAELRAADAARTSGPWVFATDKGAPQYVQLYSDAEIDEYEADVLSAGSDVLVSEENATFIALCGTHVPALLARLDAAEAALADLDSAIRDYFAPNPPPSHFVSAPYAAWRALKEQARD